MTKELPYNLYIKNHATLLARQAFSKYTDIISEDCLTSISNDVFYKINALMESPLSILYFKGIITDEEALIHNGDDVIKSSCPGLYALLKSTDWQYEQMISQMLNRITKDRPGIGKIQSIRHCGSYFFKSGQATVIIEADKKKLVYRLRDLKIDEKAYELFYDIFPGIARLPRVKDCGEYGYSEYIDNNPASTIKDARDYYHNLGSFCAIASILRARDLVTSNMRATSSLISPIDLETFIYPGDAYWSKSPEGMERLVYNMVCSGIVPYENFGKRDFCILTDVSENNLAAPVVEGSKVLVYDFIDDFIDGFRSAYSSAIEKKGRIREFANSLRGVRVRVALRMTSTYYDMLDYVKLASTKSDFDEKLLRKKIFNSFKKNDKKYNDDIFAVEADALSAGRIPYFYTTCDSRDLYSSGEIIVKNCYKQSAIEHINDIIDGLNTQTLMSCCEQIKKGIKTRKEQCYG